jgi:hypothetical protein
MPKNISGLRKRSARNPPHQLPMAKPVMYAVSTDTTASEVPPNTKENNLIQMISNPNALKPEKKKINSTT